MFRNKHIFIIAGAFVSWLIVVIFCVAFAPMLLAAIPWSLTKNHADVFTTDVVYVFITGVLAFYTFMLFREAAEGARRQEEFYRRARRPLIMMEVNDPEGDFAEAVIQNIGGGPAIDVVADWNFPAGTAIAERQGPYSLAAGGVASMRLRVLPAEDTACHFVTGSVPSALIMGITITYADQFGSKFKSQYDFQDSVLELLSRRGPLQEVINLTPATVQ